MATADGVFVFDADSHWCEPPDLFTSRAPAAVKDRVPRVEDVDGQLMWVFDGHPVGRFSAGGVVARDGSKAVSYTHLDVYKRQTWSWRRDWRQSTRW